MLVQKTSFAGKARMDAAGFSNKILGYINKGEAQVVMLTILGLLIHMWNMLKKINRRWLFFVWFLCSLSFSAAAQTTNIEIRQLAGQDFLVWNLYDSFGHMILGGADLAGEEVISLPLESNKKYVFEIIVSDSPPRDTILLTLAVNGQPVILIPGIELEAGTHTHPFYTGTSEQKLKVLGGSDADISLYPWQVFLVAGNNQCGGSIIGDKWILTAAHCLFNSLGEEIASTSMLVKAGATNPYDPSQGAVYFVKNAIIHENYEATVLDYDLALLELQQEIRIDHAEPIAIVTAEDASLGATDPGVLANLSGWGSTQVDPEVFPEKLQNVQLPIVSNRVASRVWGPIPPTFLMAGYEDAKKDACSGDSGGPLVVAVDGEYKLAGIVSWGSENCNTYGGFTRVSQFETWIRDNSGIQELDVLTSMEGDQLICRGLDSSTYQTTPLPEAQYEWILAPPEAGLISYREEQATVQWNEQYTGLAMISASVFVEGEQSAWKRLALEVVEPTELSMQSEANVLCEQESFQLALSASGHELVYDWYKDGTLWKADASDTISFPVADRSNSGTYYGIVTGSCGSIRSEDMEVTVHPLTGILSLSPETRVNNGTITVLEVAAEGHDLSYQWEKDGISIPNENLAQLTLMDVNSNNTGIYRVNLEGTCGSLTSDSIFLYVSASSYLEEPDVYIWPTISNAQFNVASNLDQSFDLLVYNMNGQLIQRMDDLRYTSIIDLSGKIPGIYLVRARSGNWSKTIKIRKD